LRSLRSTASLHRRGESLLILALAADQLGFRGTESCYCCRVGENYDRFLEGLQIANGKQHSCGAAVDSHRRSLVLLAGTRDRLRKMCFRLG
jgi:hypothetical protein